MRGAPASAHGRRKTLAASHGSSGTQNGTSTFGGRAAAGRGTPAQGSPRPCCPGAAGPGLQRGTAQPPSLAVPPEKSTLMPRSPVAAKAPGPLPLTPSAAIAARSWSLHRTRRSHFRVQELLKTLNPKPLVWIPAITCASSMCKAASVRLRRPKAGRQRCQSGMWMLTDAGGFQQLLRGPPLLRLCACRLGTTDGADLPFQEAGHLFHPAQHPAA